MAGWSLISWTDGSLPWFARKSRSQDLSSARRVATSMGGEEEGEEEERDASRATGMDA